MSEMVKYVKGIDQSYHISLTSSSAERVEIPKNMKLKIESIYVDGANLSANTVVNIKDEITLTSSTAYNSLIDIKVSAGGSVDIDNLKLRVIDTLYVQAPAIPGGDTITVTISGKLV